MAKLLGLPAHELFKVKVWLGLQGIKYEPDEHMLRVQRWKAIRAQALRLLEKFDPDQPRDDGGKWTSGGGGGSSSATGTSGSGSNKITPIDHRAPATGKNFRPAVEAAIAGIPTAAREKMEAYGVKFATDKTIAASYPNRGHDYAAGVYDPNNKTILIAEFRKSGIDDSVQPVAPIAKNVVLHESGYAFGYALGDASNKANFVAAYKRDFNRLSEVDRNKLKYFLQRDRHGLPKVGRAETFAEIFNWECGGGGPRDIRPYFPNATKLVKEAAATGKWPR